MRVAGDDARNGLALTPPTRALSNRYFTPTAVHGPIAAPQDFMDANADKLSLVPNTERRTFAAMLMLLDEVNARFARQPRQTPCLNPSLSPRSHRRC